MDDKIIKANEIISELIIELVDTRLEAIGSGNCPYAFYNRDWRKEKSCDDCWYCKEDFKDRMIKELQKKYIITDVKPKNIHEVVMEELFS